MYKNVDEFSLFGHYVSIWALVVGNLVFVNNYLTQKFDCGTVYFWKTVVCED